MRLGRSNSRLLDAYLNTITEQYLVISLKLAIHDNSLIKRRFLTASFTCQTILRLLRQGQNKVSEVTYCVVRLI